MLDLSKLYIAKARLEPLLDEGNRKQTMAAPATAIVAYDLDFARTLPKLAPRNAENLSAMLAENPEKARYMARRSAGLGPRAVLRLPGAASKTQTYSMI